MIQLFKNKKNFTLKFNNYFYNICLMKNFLRVILFTLFTLVFNKSVLACDALNIKIGTDISNLPKSLKFLEDHNEFYPDAIDPVRYDEPGSIICPNNNLDETEIQIFVFESKIIALKLIKRIFDDENKQIYNYTKERFVKLSADVDQKDWIGVEVLKYDDDIVIYSKREDGKNIEEELYISTKELDQIIDDEGDLIIDRI